MGNYYRTWVHWHLRQFLGDGYWPERWALIPIPSYVVVLLFLHPLKALMRGLVGLGSIRQMAFGDKTKISGWRQTLFHWTYSVYDYIKVHCVDAFSVRFVNDQAMWPPVEIERNPAVDS